MYPYRVAHHFKGHKNVKISVMLTNYSALFAMLDSQYGGLQHVVLISTQNNGRLSCAVYKLPNKLFKRFLSVELES